MIFRFHFPLLWCGIAVAFAICGCAEAENSDPSAEEEISPEEGSGIPDSEFSDVENEAGTANDAMGSAHPDGQVVWSLWRDQTDFEICEQSTAEPLQTEPTRLALIPRFESGRDILEDFVVSMRAGLRVVESGPYRFALAVQGDAVLFLELPDGTTREVATSTGGQAESEPVDLQAGENYTLSLIHHSGSGPDSAQVGWVLPSGKSVTVLGPEELLPATDADAIEAAVQFRALVRPVLRSYQPKKHLSRDIHAPRPDEHLTRETVYAAGAMLESDDPVQWEEAATALRKVLPYQDIAPTSQSFGNWPRTVERPGDFRAQNIGGFIGAELIHILKRHRDKLDDELTADIEKALRMAAMRSVRYDPPVTATNIVTKAVCVALLADEMLDVPEAGEWGAGKLRELHAHTVAAGMPTEYNSPTYNRVTMEALGLLRAHLQNESLRPMVNDLYATSWRELALSYHPNLQLWTGPATRRYEDLDSPAARVQSATENQLFFGESAASRIDHEIPDDLMPHFEPLDTPVEQRIPVMTPSDEAEIISQLSPLPLIATLYQHPKFSLGSFNRGDLWHQRRPSIAFWGRRDAPGMLRIISPSASSGLLPAQVYVAQEGPRQLIAINFATDAGWGMHPYDLHGYNRQLPVTTSDVRIRFHSDGPQRVNFSGAPASLTDHVVVESGDIHIGLRVLTAVFDGYQPHWEVTDDGNLDLVLYRGDPINLASIQEAACALALEISDGALSTDWLKSAEARTADGSLEATAGALKISAPVRPASYPVLQDQLVIAPDPDTYLSQPQPTSGNP